MPGVGVKIQNPLGIRECVLLAQYAEARGLSSVWVSEYRARDAFTNLALFAAATERVELGSSIIPIYTRSPTVLGASAAALNEIAPGRVIVGLGSSSQVIIERWHGLERTRPLKAMVEYVEAMRAVLSGERVSYEGEIVAIDGFSLEHEHLRARDARIYIAALGEKMLGIGGRVADGVLLNHMPVSDVARVRGIVGAATSVATDLRVGIGSTEQVAEMRNQQRKQLAYYGNVPPYNRFYAEAGFDAEAARLRDAWAARDSDAATAAVHDEMLDAIVAIGGEDTVSERVRALWEAGVDEVILFPLWADDQAPGDATRQLIDVVAELMPSDDHAVHVTSEGST